MTMTEKFKIVTTFIRDMSSETPNVETYFFAKNNITKYQLNINIDTKPIKNQHVEVDTVFKFQDIEENTKKAYFEMTYVTVVKVNNDVKERKELEKILLCDVQNKIYPHLEKSFLNLLHNSGYPQVKFDKKIDFEALYNQKQN